MSELSEGVPTTVPAGSVPTSAESMGSGATVMEAPTSDSQESVGPARSDKPSTEASMTSGDSDRVRSIAQLEEEGDIAADYIEELLDITDLDGDIDIEARDGRAYVSVNSSTDSNLRLLSKPDTVTALQELTRIAVQTKTGRRNALPTGRPRLICRQCRRTSGSWFTIWSLGRDCARSPRVKVAIATR